MKLKGNFEKKLCFLQNLDENMDQNSEIHSRILVKRL